MSEHIVEMAKALVKVKDGIIEVLTDPMIRRFPLRDELYGCEEESRETIKNVLRKHIEEFGMYSPNRVLDRVPIFISSDRL